MAEIKKSDLISDDALRAPAELAKELQKVVDSLDKIIAAAKAGESSITMADSLKKIQVETAKLTKSQTDLEKSQKAIGEAAKKRAKDEVSSLEQTIQKREHLAKTISSLKKDQKEDLQLLKEQVITRKEYDKRINESNILLLTYQQRLTNINKEVRQDIILTKQLGGEYQRLVTELSKAETKYRDLLSSSKANGNEVLRAGAAYNKLNQQVRAVDETLGKFHRNVGNYPKVVSALSSSVLQLVAAFGIHDGIRMFAHSLKEVVKLSMDFETANSRLAGVLGKQKSEIGDLRKQQLELAKVTLYNAKSYAELQIELAKLGFPVKEIEAMTASTAKASIAMGSDLAEQAELTGSILHQYNLSATQTTRVNDALSKSTTASALDFRKLATAIPYVGSAAAALGFSLEETLALMGQLANTGLASSTIGTSLRKIFLLLADSSSNLSKKFKEPVRDLPSLLSGLKELKLNSVQLGEALELTDIRSVVAFKSLIDGADKVENLNKVIQESTGFTEELAKTVKDNLGGDVKLAGSAIDSLSISIGEALEPAMRSVVQAFTFFVRALGALPKFLKENKDLILALVIALLAFRTAAIATTLENIAMSRSFQILQIRMGMALAAFRNFAVAMATNPFAILLLSVAGVITAMNIYERTLGKTGQINKMGTAINEQFAKSYERLSAALSEATVSEAEYARLTAEEKKNRIDSIRLRIAEADAMALEGESMLLLLKSKAMELSLGQQNIILKEQEMGRYDNARKMAQEYANANFENNEAYKEQQKLVTANIIKQNDLARGLRNVIKEYAGYQAALDNAKASDMSEEEFKKNAQVRKAYLDLLIFRKNLTIKTNAEIADNENQELADRLQAVRENEKLRADVIALEREKAFIVEKKGEEQSAGEIKLINEKAEAGKVEVAKEGAELRTKIAKNASLKMIKDNEEALKFETAIRVQELEAQATEEGNVIKRKYLQGKLTKEEADRELRRISTQANKEALKAQIDLLQSQLIAQQTFEAERLILVAGSAKEEAEIRKESAEVINAINLKIAELRQGILDNSFENQEHFYADEIKMLEDVLGYYVVWASSINALMDSITERRLSNIEREIREVDKWEKESLRLAGDNDKAKEQIEIDAERRREQLEKKKIAEQRKAAIREKMFTVLEIGIRTALNIVKAFPNVPLQIAAAALGAVQTAAVLAKPLPGYEKGGRTSQETIVAGEKGVELYKTPKGEYGLTPSKASVMNLPVGTEIYPHEKSMRMIAMQGVERGKYDSTTTDYALREFLGKLEKQNSKSTTRLEKAISKNKPGNLFRQGSLVMEAREDEKRNVELIRRSNLGKK